MSALVVFESMFGSTRDVAEAVAQGIGEHLPVRCVEVSAWAARRARTGDGALPPEVTLLVVGAPTHAFSLSRPSTRADAAGQAGGSLVTAGAGLREWLAALDLPPGLAVAAFDTKVAKSHLPGSAAAAAEKRLRHLGGRPVARHRSFWVAGTTEGLLPGELDAARAWGRTLTPVPAAR